jgi:GH43 family beta-xylosidase
MTRIRMAASAGLVLALVVALAGCGGQGGPVEPSISTLTGSAGMSVGSATQTYENPIVGSGQDPWVIFYNDYYYLIQSQSGGLWITKSAKDNLTDLALSGTTTKVWTPPATGPDCTDLWAPELHQIDGHWIIYYAATTCDANNANHRMFALQSTTDDPMGPYQDMGQVTDSNDRWAIDGTEFEYRGQAYFVWSGWPGTVDGQQNLYIAKMSDPFTLDGEGVLLSQPTYDWERQAMPINEGPEAIVKDDTVYLTFSASGSWTDDYCLGLLTGQGDDLLDPAVWTKTPDPVFSKTADVFGPGHASFVSSPDGTQDWMVYHSALFSGAGWTRVIDTQQFTWTDGRPNFGTPVSPGTSQSVPSGQLPPR